jgi:hypothetical protein
MRAIRHYGYCHPAARPTRERVALHTGRPLFIGPEPPQSSPQESASPGVPTCPCCRKEMIRVLTLAPSYRRHTRGPPVGVAPSAS